MDNHSWVTFIGQARAVFAPLITSYTIRGRDRLMILLRAKQLKQAQVAETPFYLCDPSFVVKFFPYGLHCLKYNSSISRLRLCRCVYCYHK